MHHIPLVIHTSAIIRPTIVPTATITITAISHNTAVSCTVYRPVPRRNKLLHRYVIIMSHGVNPSKKLNTIPVSAQYSNFTVSRQSVASINFCLPSASYWLLAYLISISNLRWIGISIYKLARLIIVVCAKDEEIIGKINKFFAYCTFCLQLHSSHAHTTTKFGARGTIPNLKKMPFTIFET